MADMGTADVTTFSCEPSTDPDMETTNAGMSGRVSRERGNDRGTEVVCVEGVEPSWSERTKRKGGWKSHLS